jgi:hypothetical protein
MKTDRVFVLLLVVLLPLSGCFDGSVGDADASDDASEGHTSDHNENELFTSFTSINPVNEGCGDYDICIWEYAYSINTTNSQALKIVSVSSTIDGHYWESYDNSNRTRITAGTPYIISNCDSGQVWNSTALRSTSYNLGFYVPTVGDICQHDIFIQGTQSGNSASNTVITNVQISLTWQIDEVTVI